VTLAWKNLQTGLFFLAGLVILTAALLIVGTNQNLFSPVYRLKGYLPDTQTLSEGTSVTLSGIEIGVIEKIDLDTWQGENAVRFDIRLKKEYQHRITTSSRAIIKSIGVLGDKFMEITLGKAGETPLADGAVIHIEPAVDYEKLMKDVSNSLVGSLQRVGSILDDIEAGRGTMGMLVKDSTLVVRLNDALDGFERTMTAMRSGNGTMGRMINDPTVYNELAETTKRMKSIMDKIDRGEGSLGMMIGDSTLYVSAASAAAGLDTTVARINQGKGTVGKALNDEGAYDDTRATIQQMRKMLEEMQKDPRKYLKFSVF
jgi:phospholipid/cholesterol/gamma-HCH transport system substrate-binding protein